MSTSDQDQAADRPIAAPRDPVEDVPESGARPAVAGRSAGPGAAPAAETRPAAGAAPDEAPADTPDEAVPAEDGGPAAQDVPESGERRLTPRQARRLRVALSSAGMVAMGVVLALRIASRSSVLVVGVYGLALILCGIVIELSRNGRTRLGSWLLAVGIVAAIGSDWLLIP